MSKIKAAKISTKFNVIVISLLILFSIIISLILNVVVADAIAKMGTEKAKGDLNLGYTALDHKFPGNWEVKGDKLYKGNTLVNNNEEMVDYIAEMTNGTVTIFLGDTRVTTNVMNNGKRAVGTQASPEVIQQTLKNDKNYYGEANVVGNLYQTAYQTIKDANGETVGMWYVGAPANLIKTSVQYVNIVLLSSLGVLIVVALFVVMIFTNRIKKRLHRLELALEAAGNGDFTTEVTDHGGDEIASLSKSYSKMRGNLTKLVKQIIEAADTVAASAEELNAGAEETARATDSISFTVQEVAASADQQVAHTGKLNQTVNSMTTGIKYIAETVENAQGSMEVNSVSAKNGAKIMEKTRKQVVLIDEMTKSTSESIHQLNEKSKEIGKIINMITDISEQTNLLALNAAIEAARAGDHGRGFAVVAEEVRKLAEQSNRSANQIKELIFSIQEDITLSVDSMDNGRTAIQEGLDLASNAEASFNDLNVWFQSFHSQIGDVSGDIRSINHETSNMITILEDITHKINETSEATQSVAATTEQQSASMQEIYAFSQSLSKLAEDLRTVIGAFRL